MRVFFISIVFIFITFSSFATGDKYRINDLELDRVIANSEEIYVDYIINQAPISISPPTEQIDEKNQTAAGLLGIFLGGLGIHRAYSGSSFKVWGVYAGVTVGSVICGTAGSFVGCPIGFAFTGISGTVGLIDGIIMLAGSESDYQSKWVGSEKLFNW